VHILRRPFTAAVLFFFCLQCTLPACAYSVLTHEEIIDITWASDLQPLIMQKFPHSTPEELKEAHAYAYGGSIIQDLGYYPHGRRQFSDLVHYVRSGAFVHALLTDAQNANEYAFALGALAHYTSDIVGHPAVNSAVAIEFPKLKAKYGDKVTYEQNTRAHLQTEFGFDMDQVAKHRYTSDNYHDFIGFKVASGLLERAFQETYGIKLEQALPDPERAIESYRHAVSELIPQMTRVALKVRKDDVAKEYPTKARRQFLFNLSRADYEKRWGTNYFKDSFKTRLLSFLLNTMPKVGPFKALGFKVPTSATEDLYFKSINSTISRYQVELQRLREHSDKLEAYDLDTGLPTKRGEYSSTDRSYDELLRDLSKQNFTGMSKELRADLLTFYLAPSPVAFGAKPEDQKVTSERLKSLEQLRARIAADVLTAVECGRPGEQE
jgi:hypothetical protein